MLPIERLIIQGITEGIQEVFGVPNIKFVSTTDKMRMHQILAAQLKENTVTYPFAFLRLGELAVQDDAGYNVKSLARHGVYVKIDDVNGVAQNASLLPVKMTFELTFLTDSFDSSFDFCVKWCRASVANALNFTIGYGDIDIDIACEITRSISVPDKDMSVDMPNNYEYVGMLLVRGYISDLNAQGQASTKDVPMVRRLNVNMKAGVGATALADYQLDKTITKEPE